MPTVVAQALDDDTEELILHSMQYLSYSDVMDLYDHHVGEDPPKGMEKNKMWERVEINSEAKVRAMIELRKKIEG